MSGRLTPAEDLHTDEWDDFNIRIKRDAEETARLAAKHEAAAARQKELAAQRQATNEARLADMRRRFEVQAERLAEINKQGAQIDEGYKAQIARHQNVEVENVEPDPMRAFREMFEDPNEPTVPAVEMQEMGTAGMGTHMYDAEGVELKGFIDNPPEMPDFRGESDSYVGSDGNKLSGTTERTQGAFDTTQAELALAKRMAERNPDAYGLGEGEAGTELLWGDEETEIAALRLMSRKKQMHILREAEKYTSDAERMVNYEIGGGEFDDSSSGYGSDGSETSDLTEGMDDPEWSQSRAEGQQKDWVGNERTKGGLPVIDDDDTEPSFEDSFEDSADDTEDSFIKGALKDQADDNPYAGWGDDPGGKLPAPPDHKPGDAEDDPELEGKRSVVEDDPDNPWGTRKINADPSSTEVRA